MKQRRSKTVFVLLLLLALFCAAQSRAASCTGPSQAAASLANITACVECGSLPAPDFTNPASPVINYQIGNDPSNPVNRPPAGTGFAARYQMQISADSSFSSLTYDTGQQAYGTSYTYENGAVAAGCDFRILNQCYCYVGGVIAPCSGVPPTTVSGHPAPRCGCDSAPDSGNCPNSFNASAGDPGNCYDWYEEASSYSCYGNEYGQYTCSCPAGGTCSFLQCNTPWDPYSLGCSCLDGTTCSSFSCGYNETTGYQCSCTDNPCVFQKATQFTKTEHLALQPAGNYSFTVPAGTLSINNSTYYYRVRVKDSFDWSPWVQGSMAMPASGVCGTANGTVSCNSAGDKGGTLCSQGSVINMTSVNCGWYWVCQGQNGGGNSPTCKSYRAVPLGSCGTVPF